MYPSLYCHTEYFQYPKNILYSTYSSLSPTSIPCSHWSFYHPIVLLSLECHVVGILKYVAFSDWLLSLRKVHLIFLHVIPRFDSSSLLALYNIPLPRCITVYLSVDLLKNILVAFQILSIMNKAVTNIYLEDLCVDISFQLLWVNAKDRVTWSYIRNCQIFFQSGCPILVSLQQWIKITFAPDSHQHLVLSLFRIFPIFKKEFTYYFVSPSFTIDK